MGHDLANPFVSACGDMSAMRPFAKLLWTFVVVVVVLLLLLLLFLAHQHKAAGMKIKLSKNNDHDGILLGVKSA